MAKTEKELISFRLDSNKRKTLDKIAELKDRDRSYIFNEAVDQYLDLYQWQVEQIEIGLAEIKAGNFAPKEEVEAFFKQWEE